MSAQTCPNETEESVVIGWGYLTAKFALMKVSKISHQNRNTPTNLPSHTHSVLLETPLIYHFFFRLLTLTIY